MIPRNDLYVHEHFDCQCENFMHSVRFSYDLEYGELQVETHLGNWLPWYKRVWLAIKYVFKRTHPAHLQYDCTLIHPADYQRLRALLDEAERFEHVRATSSEH